MSIEIKSLGYDPEADELDLLINHQRPQPGYMIDVGGGILIRRHMETDEIVGAIIHGYTQFARDVRNDAPFDWTQADEKGMRDVVEAILEWQRDVDRLSQDLAGKLGNRQRQQALIETLLELPLAA